MEIACFYFYRFLRSGQYRRHLEELRATGVDSIFFNVDETETLYWHEKELKRACGIAHELGLRLYMGFCRFGRVFAGDRWIPSEFACGHPQTHVVDANGLSHRLCCVNNPEFRRWYFETTETLLQRFEVDGISLDEPKGSHVVCHCPTCSGMVSSIDELPALRLRSLVGFLADCCRSAKAIDCHLTTMLVAMHSDRDLLREAAAIDPLDVVGTDPYWIYFGKDLHWMSEEAASLVSLARSHGKRAQLWVQNFGVPQGRETEIPEAFECLAALKPDQLCTFYDIIQNDDPDAVWAVTKEAIRQIKSAPPAPAWPRA